MFLAISAAAGDLREITILQTADLHSRTGSPGEPGIRQLAAALAAEREKAGGAEKCLLIDCGDILQGSYAASASRGELGISFLNCLGYDVWIPGNHDFDFGTGRLMELMKICRPMILAGNLKLDGRKPLLPWKIVEKDGARIAVIGMTSPGLDRWHWGKAFHDISSSAFSAPLDEIMPEIMKANCDMIILAVHQGPFQSERTEPSLDRIAEKYPQIDLVLGAHSHQPVPGENTGISSWYIQPGPYCASFSVVNAQIDVKKHRVVRIESTLVSVPAEGVGSFKFPSGMERMLSECLDASRKEIISVDREIPADELNRMTAGAYFKKLPDVAIALLVPQDRTIPPGRISEGELYWIFPFEDTVCSIELSDERLKAVLEEASKLKDGTRLQIIENMRMQGNGLRKKAAVSSYLLAGAGGRLRLLADFANDPECRAADTGITLREAFRDFLGKKSPAR